MIYFDDLQYGFKYGAAEVTRLVSDEKRGYVVIGIKTPRRELQVYVTKTGLVRIHDVDGNEWRISDEA